MLGHVEVDDAPALVGEHDENEEDAQAGGGNGEEVDRHEVPDMVGEERAPGLRGGCAPLRHQPGDGAFGHLEAQLQEFAMDSGRTPQGIGRGDSRDQSADFGVDRRAAHGGAAGERGPVVAEASPLPSQHSGWSHDDEGPPPPGPHPRQPDPEESISFDTASAGARSACTRRADGAARGFRGRAGDGRRRGTGRRAAGDGLGRVPTGFAIRQRMDGASSAGGGSFGPVAVGGARERVGVSGGGEWIRGAVDGGHRGCQVHTDHVMAAGSIVPTRRA